MTLLELLLALTISIILVGPLTAWLVVSLQSQSTARSQLGRANSTGLLTSYFARDVTSALRVTAVRGPGDPVADCDPAGGGAGPVRLQIISAGSSPERIVYTEAPSSDGPGLSVWRRRCSLGSADPPQVAEVFRGVTPGSTQADCPASVAAADPCAVEANRQVQLSTTPDGTTAPVTIRGTRRTTTDSTGLGTPGNYPPVANISVSQTTGYQDDTAFTFDAGASSDRDGRIVSTSWTFPAGSCVGPRPDPTPTCTFSTKGKNIVRLAVTDDKGGTGFGTWTIDIRNRFPVAVARVTPSSGNRGETFRLDGTASTDPDASDRSGLTYRWDLGDDLPADVRNPTGVTADVTIPLTARGGPRQITLAVTDPSGDTASSVAILELDGGTPSGPVQIIPEPINVPGKVARVGSVGVGLAPVDVRFVPRAPVPAGGTGWRLYRRGTTDVVALSCPDPMQCTRTFGPTDAGEYDIVRVSDPGSGPVESPRVSFRLNAAPTAAINVLARAGTVPRTVDYASDGSTDVDGTVTSRRWRFGFFDFWTSTNPTVSQSFTGPGDYLVELAVVDDEGAIGLASTPLNVAGTPAAPPTPTWIGWNLALTPMPGAQSYAVQLVYDCGPDPRTLTPTVPAAAQPLLAVEPPATRCGSAGTVTASVSVTANAVTGPASATVARTG